MHILPIDISDYCKAFIHINLLEGDGSVLNAVVDIANASYLNFEMIFPLLCCRILQAYSFYFLLMRAFCAIRNLIHNLRTAGIIQQDYCVLGRLGI